MTRRRVLGAALIVAPLLACVAPAPGETVVGRDARTAVALTIYSGQDLALVRESRPVDLEGGESTLRFEDVAARLDPRTTTLTAVPGDAFAVLEQSYLFDLSSPQALQERWVGRGVELVETDSRLRTRVTQGTLLSTDGGNVYRIGDRIAIGHPGWLFLPPSGDDVFTRPTLRWRVSNTGTAHRTLELSYATGGLSWDADYVVLLGADDAHADVSAWAIAVRLGERVRGDAGNEKPAAITVAVRDQIDGDWQVMESSVPARKADARTLALDVPVPAGGEAVLRYRVRVGR